jgi:hypothetical protein
MAQAQQKKPRSRSSSSSRSKTKASSGATANGRSKMSSVTDTVSSGAKNAAEAVDSVPAKAKTGLLAGGAAAAGLAATAIAARRSRKPKMLGVSLPRRKHGLMPMLKSLPLPGRSSGVRGQTQRTAAKVSGAAEQADKLGQRLSSVARSVRQVSETAKEAAKKG